MSFSETITFLSLLSFSSHDTHTLGAQRSIAEILMFELSDKTVFTENSVSSATSLFIQYLLTATVSSSWVINGFNVLTNHACRLKSTILFVNCKSILLFDSTSVTACKQLLNGLKKFYVENLLWVYLFIFNSQIAIYF